jgi:hypothetical protein
MNDNKEDWRSIILKIKKDVDIQNIIKVKPGWVCMHTAKDENGKIKRYGRVICEYGLSSTKENISLYNVCINYEKYKRNYNLIYGENAYENYYKCRLESFSESESEKDEVDEIESIEDDSV